VTDLSRISKTFHLHPKAIKARHLESGSISLWLFANCWCRNHRREGVIPREEALNLGSEAEIKALVDSGLWEEVAEGYAFRDWHDWNPDLIRSNGTASAAYLVQVTLPQHPHHTQDRLASEVLKLMDEGVPRKAIEAGLRTWGERKEGRFSWLPYYVSDAIREGDSGISAAIKRARETWNMAPLAEFGFRWSAPDVPEGMQSPQKVRAWMRQQKSAWLNEVEAGIRGDESTER
jgi:hypothetical protein